MLCSECGYSNHDDYSFCQDCGAPLPGPASDAAKTVLIEPAQEAHQWSTILQEAVADAEAITVLQAQPVEEFTPLAKAEVFSETRASSDELAWQEASEDKLAASRTRDESDEATCRQDDLVGDETTTTQVAKSGFVSPARLMMLGGGIVISAIISAILLASRPSASMLAPESSRAAESREVDSPAVNRPEPRPTGPPQDMIYIPGGTFMMGEDKGNEYNRPQHSVYVEPFFIDKTEVTNADYQRFVDQTGHTPPPDWENGHFADGKGDLPVVSVSWYDAREYAQWAGKRLPTEAEWEMAARGTDGRRYPWGSTWRPGLAVTKESGASGPARVGSRPAGASPYGLLDMCGNVFEWNADDFALYPGSTADPAPANSKVLRGGAFNTPYFQTCTTDRYYYGPGHKDGLIGFRCARDGQNER